MSIQVRENQVSGVKRSGCVRVRDGCFSGVDISSATFLRIEVWDCVQVLTGLMPFNALRDTEISYKVIQGDRPALPADAEDLGMSNGLWRLLTRCWHAECNERPPIDEVLQCLSDDPARGVIFPPSRFPGAYDRESSSEFEKQQGGRSQ